MKRKIFYAITLILGVLIASCTGKKSAADQLVGVWTGVDSISIATMDTSGNVMIETIAVPIVIEYFADTTMKANINYNDSTTANVSAVVLIGGPYITYKGMMYINDQKQDISGELFYQEDPEQLSMEFYSENRATGQKHSGKGTLTRKE